VASAAAAVAAGITALLPAVLPMQARVYKDEGSQSLAIRFTGRLPVARANERVTLVVRECNTRYFRQVGGALTTATGGWELTVGGGYGFPFGSSGSTYRVRWKNRMTSPFTWRTRLPVGVTKAGSTVRVSVYTGYASPLQDLAGRDVVLQRLSDGRFVDVRRRKLRAVDARTFSASFALTTRGLTMRVLLPTKSARPCYNAGVSNVFES
jgi:hypothetical protein